MVIILFDFDLLNAPSFSWQKAHILAHLSNLAYEKEEALNNILVNKYNFNEFEFVENSEIQFFMISKNGFTAIIFRGTDELADWFVNLDVEPIKIELGKVHSGFYAAYEQNKTTLTSWLERAISNKHKIYLSGHSLGGALSLITAINSLDSIHESLNGIYTFGQPKTINSKLANHLQTPLSDKYFRFVNDDDIVPRVPLGYHHGGQLIHFDGDGNPNFSSNDGAEQEGISTEDTEEEFSKIKSKIKSLTSTLETLEIENKDELLDVSLEGIFPSITDHSMERYLRLIRKQANSGYISSSAEIQQVHLQSKLESLDARREAEAEGVDEILVATERGMDPSHKNLVIPALVQTKSENWTPPDGIKINSKIGNILSIQSNSFEALKKLENNDEIISMEVSRDAGIEELDKSIKFVGADTIHRPNIQERGNAALVGIIDSGIDILHKCFTNQDGQTRILAIWDQRSADENFSPTDQDPEHFQQSYGRLYLQDEIETFIQSPSNTPISLRDFGKHGTHVSSIAAGRSVGSDVKDGMAPECGIIVVIPNMKTGRNDPPSLGYSSSHVDALNFLKLAAAGSNVVSNLSLPIAVNVSLGMNAGAHDGSSLLEIAFDVMSNNGKDPGYAIVKSAGNERGHGGHARIRTLSQKDILWKANNYSRFQDYFEAWYSHLDELEFVLSDPDGNESNIINSNNLTTNQLLGGNRISMTLQPFHRDNGDNRLVITIEEDQKQIQTGTWKLIVTPIAVRSQNAFFDMWVERDRIRSITFINQDDMLTLSIPGTAQHVITVGASGSALPIRLTSSSSYGKTRDDRAKPDICAPGTEIKAALAGGNNGEEAIPLTGTSMAAPHVTGAIALIFSHLHKKHNGQKQLNARQIHSGLISTARSPHGGSLHDEGVGFGGLDAEEFFKLMSQH